ncbi:PREDICTED: N-acetylgalactosaminyltransferase 6 [Ceratosolen solmsi marchali]|uniref:Polypeptide N-acetylgalactosaminyltransferase n=1 Tax=Ceratosolen solmsi marchali TaxID=326594 RepID=A0AAJ6YX58_9HYME|nr:PREDICTED: N-acetylgalactosaminyltransferase 6 [Ceratosolen solmsi marchali]
MKRNLISWFKFLALAAFTVFLTTLIFRLLRTPRSRGSLVQMNIEDGRKMAAVARSPLKQMLDEKVDWHDYEGIREELKRTGIGEQGKAAMLPPSLDLIKFKLYEVNGFNAALSDQISVNRSIPDIRHQNCKKKKYSKNLDSVSVIVSFHNEHFSTLMRTCWSVINRSPPNLLQEIILVDDASTKLQLKDNLDEYVKKNLPKVKIIRLSERSGLIRGRLAGAEKAVAKILVFLDSHSEANVNWLPPLLEPISRDYKTCVCPFIDVIAYESFEYRAQDEGARGAFDWELYYKRLPLLPEDMKNPTEPFKSPIMAGGLFAISAKFFWELGGYDPGLDIWGGEQYELSFKIWQCGGQMYDAPCSRVGHIYRKFPPFPNPGHGDFLGKNYRRVAEVWMDEYAEFIYRRRPHLKTIDPGDLTEQKALREKLQCKSFKWFIENIAFDLVKVYPPIEPDDFAHGEIRNIGAPNLCLNIKGEIEEEEVVVDICKKDNTNVKGDQEFQLTWHKDVRPYKRTECLDVSKGDEKSPVTLYPCHGKQGNQLWRYNVEKQWLIHGHGYRCLDTDPAQKKIFVTNCDDASSTQKWRIEHVNMKAMNHWEYVTV